MYVKFPTSVTHRAESVSAQTAFAVQAADLRLRAGLRHSLEERPDTGRHKKAYQTARTFGLDVVGEAQVLLKTAMHDALTQLNRSQPSFLLLLFTAELLLL